MGDLTVLLEHVEKPHNLSAILSSCDAVGVLEAHAVCLAGRLPNFSHSGHSRAATLPTLLRFAYIKPVGYGRCSLYKNAA
jgi:tRNA (guanosine-2'-O-)-methyltransferase